MTFYLPQRSIKYKIRKNLKVQSNEQANSFEIITIQLGRFSDYEL